MGNPFGKPGYSEKRSDMREASKLLQNQAGIGYSPGSSGYNVGKFSGNSYGVNPETGRSFTTVQKLNDYVPGGYENAFSQMANAQMDALKRGMAGGTRSAVSQFGRSGLGSSGVAKMAAQNAANMSRGASDIRRQNLMDKLGYGTNLYQFERSQGLQDELGLRGARTADAAGRRSDWLANLQGLTSQFNMDRGSGQDAFNRRLETYKALNKNKPRGSSGWLGKAVKTGAQIGAALI